MSRMAEAASLVVWFAALVLGYVLLSILRAVLFPPRVQPVEYKAKQVRPGLEAALTALPARS